MAEVRAACLELGGSGSKGGSTAVLKRFSEGWAGLGWAPKQSVDCASLLSYKWGPGSYHNMCNSREGRLVSITVF